MISRLAFALGGFVVGVGVAALYFADTVPERAVRPDAALPEPAAPEVAVNDDRLEKAIQAISQGARDSGGWGHIFVTELTDVITAMKLRVPARPLGRR